MRRPIALLGSALRLSTLMTGTSTATSADPASAERHVRPAVKEVERGYGGGPVRLRARQGVEISFRARRGDQVMLDVRSRLSGEVPCFGTQTLVDRRGSRTSRIAGPGAARIVAVRTTGRATLRSRGVCSSNEGQQPHPTRVQLTKVRLREVGRDGRG